jgi:hypothetical protein
MILGPARGGPGLGPGGRVVTGSRPKTRRRYGPNAAEIAQLGCPRVGQRPALPSESGLWAPGGHGGMKSCHSGPCLPCTATCAGGFPAHRGAPRAAVVTGRPGPLRARSYNVCKVVCTLRGAWALGTMRPRHSEPWLISEVPAAVTLKPLSQCSDSPRLSSATVIEQRTLLRHARGR